jgi:hypothetical protein
MREGLDSVDPTIQGVVSGIYTSTFCEFSGEAAEAFAGNGNPRIIRLNGGPYAKAAGGARFFTSNMFRAAILRENVKDKVDIFLAETDTCPQNRYSTSAALLHAHFTGSILEGATGAKHWITRLGPYEPASGKAYRKKLSKYNKFYEALTEYAKELRPFGCRIPLTLMQNYRFKPTEDGLNLSPWASCVLERLGLPLYFGNEGEGAVFVDDFSIDGFSDEEIKKFLSGTLILSVGAADKLYKRGFGDYLGVRVASDEEATKTVVGGESVNGTAITAQYARRELIPTDDTTEWLSEVFHKNTVTEAREPLYPGVTRFNNSFGGETIVFSGTPDMPFAYSTAFSMLNETRKKQLISILSKRDNLPIYYPEDADLYLRAGRLPSGEIMAVAFDLSQDPLDELPLVIKDKVTRIERLNERGERVPCSFETKDGVTYVKEPVFMLDPIVLFIS